MTLPLTCIHREKCEPSHVLRLKRQRHLKARLEFACDPKPDWFWRRLREETGLSEVDCATVLLTGPGGVALEEKQLEKLERFIQSYLAGGITAVRGEEVPLVDLGILQDKIFVRPSPSAAPPTPAMATAPAATPVTPLAIIEGAESTGLVTRRMRLNRPAEKSKEFLALCRDFTRLEKPVGFHNAFLRAAGLSTADVHGLNHEKPFHDVRGKYARIRKAISQAHRGELEYYDHRGAKGPKRMHTVGGGR